MKLPIWIILAISAPAFAIVGGRASDPGSAIVRASVSLRTKDSGAPFCSGTLVSKNAILTAAHCVYGKRPQDLAVMFGAQPLVNVALRPVVEIFIPREYKTYSNTLPNSKDHFDIAIVKFDRSFPVGAKPAVINKKFLTADDNGKIFSIAGYGQPNAGILSECDTRLQNAEFAQSEIMLMANSACSPGGGDSGGPVYRVNNDEVTLYAIHNWGWEDQAGNPLYSVEVKTSFYAPWIEAILILKR